MICTSQPEAFYFTCLFEGLHWGIMQKQGVLSLSFVASVQWREDLDFKRSHLCTIKGKARAQPRIREPDLSGLTWSEATGWCRWSMSYVNQWTITYSSIRFKYILYITMLLFSVSKKRDNKCCEERAILDWRGHPQLNLIIWRIRIYTV